MCHLLYLLSVEIVVVSFILEGGAALLCLSSLGELQVSIVQ